MLGALNETQINNLLLSQAIGRIGYTDGKFSYVLPVTYVYDGRNIFIQSREGHKIEVLRKHPNVCFQVDLIMNMANWQSVLLHGTFRELKGKEATKAREILFERVMPLTTSSTVHSHEHQTDATIDDSNRIKPIMYQIKISRRTGRYEKQ